MKKHNLLSIIVPSFRQEKTIVRDITNILSSLEQLNRAYELIIVVDGYVDKTMQKAKTIKNKHVKVVGYKTNKGKGYAVRYGMVQSSGSVIGFLDAGGDISPNGIYMALVHFDWYNADIIIGSKRHPVSKVQYPILRKVMSFVYQKIVQLLFGLHVRDTQVGLKLYRREVLEDVFPRLLVKQFAFDIEMLAVANHLGYSRIYESPVELDFSGASSITNTNFWYVIYRMLWDTAAVFYRLKILRYYDNTNKRKWKYDPELNFRINI